MFEANGYNSFHGILKDLPMNVVVLSVVTAVGPFVLYYASKNPQARRAAVQLLRLVIGIFYKRKSLETRVAEEYGYMQERTRRLTLRSVLSIGMGVSMLLLSLVALKKLVFFGLVVSQSMAPTLMQDDLVLLESVTKNVNVGDIVLFKPPGSEYSVVHRIVHMEGDAIRTKGDNTDAVDDWILSKKDVKAKAVRLMGQPITLKNFGAYFVAKKTVGPGVDPAFEITKKITQFMHSYGSFIMLSILLLVLLNLFSRKGAIEYPAE